MKRENKGNLVLILADSVHVEIFLGLIIFLLAKIHMFMRASATSCHLKTELPIHLNTT